MMPNRRRFIAGAGAAALAGMSAPARALVPDSHAELLRHLMGLIWIGKSWTKSDLFRGGELLMQIGMSFDLKTDWSYTGAMVLRVNLAGDDYEGHFTIAGECWVIGTDVGVSIYRSQLVEGTPLPRDFAWGTSKGDFRFYNDSGRKGHFTLQGQMRDDADGTPSRVIMVDSD